MIKRNTIFLTEDDGGGSGGDSSVTTQTAAPSAPAFDAKEFATQFGKEIGGVLAEREQRAPKQFSAEERAAAQKALGFWEPDDTFITEFGNIETQKQAFAKMRDGLTQQMVAIQRAQLAELEAKFEQRLTPVQKMIQEREVSEQKSRFAKQYPTLSNPKLTPVIDAIGQKLASAGAFQGKDEAAAFDILARGVEEVIQQTNPTFKLDQPNPGRSGNAIPHTSSGSGGGGGNSDGGRKLSSAASILGPVKIKA